jgi:ATP-dependent helicase/nuclease subunit A
VKPRRLTEQQARAVDAEGFSVVLSSGAGCGKTSVLTERYLKHLDDGAAVPQVAAITFTERAARQMRGRIREAITERLRDATGEAVARWTGHLRDLESAPIGTIHAFCGNILRQNAVAAGLDPRFEVLEVVLADALRAESLRGCLQDLLTRDTPAGNSLRELVVLYGWFPTVEAIRELVEEPDAAAWTAWLQRPPEQIETEWLGEQRDRLCRAWAGHVVATDPKVAHCLSLLSAAPCTSQQMKASVARILAETPKLAEAANPVAAAKELHELAKVGGEKVKAWGGDEDVYAQVKDAFEGYREALKKFQKEFADEPEELTEAVRVGQRFVRVALDVADAYQARKARAGGLDFQDLLVRARDLLRDHPAAREALRQRFRFLLLDEMQDTDPVQMELIAIICGDLGLGKLFAVGDHKQSIYRFRGAEVRLFRELRGKVPEYGRLELSRNFRSQPPILDFVNALCSLRVADYEPLHSDRPAVNSSPCVEFLWSVPADDAGKENVGVTRRREADAIARRLRDLLDGGVPCVWDKDAKALRPAALKDVVLLFRSMSNVGIYEEALRNHGLDYYLVGGRAFFAQQEIYDLLNLLRALENPDDALSLAGALRSPFGCLSDETLLALAGRGGEIWDGLHDDTALKRLPREQRAAALRARTNFARWRALKDRLPIARLIGEVFADSGYDAAVQFESLGDRKLANLWKLQDLARTFDRSGLLGLSDFITRLGELVANQPREEQAATLPEEADVVKLMSIHQAKGLEFPVVVVPDLAATSRGGQWASARWSREFGCLARPPADEEPPPFANFGWRLGEVAEKIADWQEDLRVLYVACTRAEDLLILSAGLKEPLPAAADPRLPLPLKAPSAWLVALGERFNLRTGECIAADVPREKAPPVAVRIDDGSLRGVQPRRAKRKPALLALDSGPPELPSIIPRLIADACDEARLLFRAALERWDFADADGWQRCLDHARHDHDFADADEAVRAASAWFGTFAASQPFADARAATQRLTGIEYLARPSDGGPLRRGCLDLLWQDAGGAWHLLAFTLHDEAGAEERLALALSSARAQLGRELKSCVELDLGTGDWRLIV